METTPQTAALINLDWSMIIRTVFSIYSVNGNNPVKTLWPQISSLAAHSWPTETLSTFAVRCRCTKSLSAQHFTLGKLHKHEIKLVVVNCREQKLTFCSCNRNVPIRADNANNRNQNSTRISSQPESELNQNQNSWSQKEYRSSQPASGIAVWPLRT